MTDDQPVVCPTVVQVVVDTPRHSGLGDTLSYAAERPLAPGTLVRVPLGRRRMLGMVWTSDAAPGLQTPPDTAALKPIEAVLDALPPLSPSWLALTRFAARYYQRSLGEVVLSALPRALRQIDATQLARRLKRLPPVVEPAGEAGEGLCPVAAMGALSQDQAQVFAQWQASGPKAHLLWGVTGSGKTQVYLHAAQDVIASGGQVLIMVPEINLTPQFMARITAQFPGIRIVEIHSGLTPAQRLKHWLMAHLGQASLVLGTRMAVFASLPRLGLVVVDEEHDPSYKQQEGARYSARDLAVMRGHIEKIPVLLGSATPSLETWFNAFPQAMLTTVSEARHPPSSVDISSVVTTAVAGRYGALVLPQRIGGGALPKVRLIDWEKIKGKYGTSMTRDMGGLTPALREALQARLLRKEQSLLLLNRRGYAPVLHCTACAWKSACPHCSAWQVFHKTDLTLRCHHCGYTVAAPRVCPDCGHGDIDAMGGGTERLEESLAQCLPTARIGRIDADTTRDKGSLAAQLARVHDGDVDIVVGTQMIAKGHDFRNMTLVAAVNPDAALFSSDFRAPERLFALLMQAAGRAGRDAGMSDRSEMMIQTWHADHPLYQALKSHDFVQFAHVQLLQRQQAGLPPFVHLALLRAEAREQDIAQNFLQAAAALMAQGEDADAAYVYPPVPTPIQRVANVERAQMLIEASTRAALQRALSTWVPQWQVLCRQHKGVLRWAVDVDPLAI